MKRTEKTEWIIQTILYGIKCHQLNMTQSDSLDGYGTATLPSFPRGRSSVEMGGLAECWFV